MNIETRKVLHYPASMTENEEVFCRDFASFGDKIKAYRRAFPTLSIPPDEFCRDEADALLMQEDVQARILHIRLTTLHQHDVSLDSVLTELEEVRALSLADHKYASAINAIMGKAKLLGYEKTRVEHTGADGSPLLTPDSVEETCKRLAFIVGAATGGAIVDSLTTTPAPTPIDADFTVLPPDPEADPTGFM